MMRSHYLPFLVTIEQTILHAVNTLEISYHFARVQGALYANGILTVLGEISMETRHNLYAVHAAGVCKVNFIR